MENSLTLTREFDPVSQSAGQAIYVSRFNIWKKALSIPNNQLKVIYVNPLGIWEDVSLSETDENIYWILNSTDEAQLVSEYVHEVFTVKKIVTFSSISSIVDIEWNIEAHQDLASVKLEVITYMEPSLDFKEALVPGVLEWQNPWDNASVVNPYGDWAVVEGTSDILNENIVAMIDEKNGVLAVFELDDPPNWFILGALADRFVDAFKLRYELGDLAEGEKSQVSLSLLVWAFEFEEIEKGSTAELKELLETSMNLPVQGRDFLTYIEEYNIKFVAVDTQKVVSNIEATPALDKIYDNGRATIYTTKR
jgi:hypothetical protein